MKRIESDIINFSKKYNLTDLEPLLSEKFGEIVRWAIIDSDDNVYKISFSYELKEV